MFFDLTPEEKQALYCGSDWKLPPEIAGRMNEVRAEFERAALAEASLPISEYQYSHADTGTIVVSHREPDAGAKLEAIRNRYAGTPGVDYRGFETPGGDIFRRQEGWTTGGDALGWIRLNQDVVLAMVGHEVYAGNEKLQWAVVAQFDPRLPEKPISAAEAERLRATVEKLKQSPGRPRISTDNPKTLAQRRWRESKKGTTMKIFAKKARLGSGREILESAEGAELCTLRDSDTPELKRLEGKTALSPQGRVVYPGEFQGRKVWLLPLTTGQGIQTLYERGE